MRIALIRPPATYANWHRNPALGIAYIAAFLEQQDHTVSIFDAYFFNWSDLELIGKVCDFRPDVVGITAMTHEIVQAVRITEKIKTKTDATIVVGGCHTTALPERTLSEFPIFDYGIYGEGERSFSDLLDALSSVKPLAGVNGLVYRGNNGFIIKNPPVKPLDGASLDALPFPAYHHYYGKNRPSFTDKCENYLMLTSRGCPCNCAFCMQVLGRQVRRYSVERICKEVDHAIKNYGAKHINFADDVFLFNNQQTFTILESFIRHGYPHKITWSAQVRANYVTEELVTCSKKAGCTYLAMGVESGDDTILCNINKGITVASVRNAVSIIKKHKINIGAYYILGHPDETLETARKTIDFAVALNTNTVAVGIMVPYPGTRIYEMACKGEGGYTLLSKNWSDYDKYFARSLAFKNVTYDQLQRLQKKAIMMHFIKNFKIIDCIQFLWRRRKAIVYGLLRKR